MEAPLNPLSIHELLDQCIFFLRDLPPALKACALVSRTWAGTAQPYLFRKVSLRGAEQWRRLEEILHTSPHLVRHIHRLYLRIGSLFINMISAVCNFAFTNIRHLFIDALLVLSLPSAIAIQQLLSIPTLCRVRVTCVFNDSSDFQQIWAHYSPSIIHLDLSYSWTDRLPIPYPYMAPIPDIRLESLQITVPRDPPSEDFFPFVLSGLKVLSIGVHTEIARWNVIVPALQTIIALSFTVSDSMVDIIDLSLFPQLRFLRISMDHGGFQNALDALSTITASSCIRTIVIIISLPAAVDHELLDFKLSNLPMHHPPTVEIEMDPYAYDRASGYPRANREWFNNFSVNSLPL
ncbi:hypothetical protein DFH09DRAFT_118976 [Mycena vulgaris]|nr:hypothetical protein DFH09DRAFT_118976 [Mycena vulgaris]